MRNELEHSATKLVNLLRARRMRLSTSESCTGGMIAEIITSIPGASDVFWGAIVAYQNDAKSGLLGISPEVLQTHGAVSARVAEEMAAGGLRQILTQNPKTQALCISTTGIAGPSGGTDDKPVGLCFLGLASTRGGVSSTKVLAPSMKDRAQNQEYFVKEAFSQLLKFLESNSPC